MLTNKINATFRRNMLKKCIGDMLLAIKTIVLMQYSLISNSTVNGKCHDVLPNSGNLYYFQSKDKK